MPVATVVNVTARQICDVYVGRGGGKFPASKLGNPFVVGKDGTRAEVVEKFRALLPGLRGEILLLAAKLAVNRQLRLGCHCDGPPCHAYVIAEAVNAALEEACHC